MSDRHSALIDDQFTRQAQRFAASPALHNEAALNLLVEASGVAPHHETLDVACGPGTVVAAFARRARRSIGLDATEAMLDQARRLAARLGLTNVEWHQGDVYRLPFDDNAMDVVSCRFAFHHLLEPARAFAEMLRVCRVGGKVVLCDGLASDDPQKAEALNAMEHLRDPSTVAFRPVEFYRRLFASARVTPCAEVLYQVPGERDALVAASFPANDDRDAIRRIIDASVDGDRLGMNARREGDTVVFGYPAVILAATKI